MKKVRFTLSLFLCLHLCLFAQKSPIQKNPVDQKVLAFSEVPFDYHQIQLKPKFLGNNVVEVYSSLLRWDSSFKKSEFETQDAFDKRMETFESIPFSHGMRASDLFGFVVKPVISYDAENERLTVSFPHDEGVLVGGESQICNWVESEKAGTSYIGSNSFGVKRLIRRVNRSRYNIGFDRPLWLDMDYKRADGYGSGDGFILKKVPGEKAQLLSIALRVVLIGPLQAPFISHSTGGNDPTISDPVDLTIFEHNVHMGITDLWLVDVVTGEIIKKYSNPENETTDQSGK